jgi:hypothetical protein
MVYERLDDIQAEIRGYRFGYRFVHGFNGFEGLGIYSSNQTFPKGLKTGGQFQRVQLKVLWG